MKRYYVSALAVLSLTSSLYASGINDYLGAVWATGASFCPAGSLAANGQTLNINDYEALYSLFGTTYGGDAQRTFALPNLNGRTPVGLTNGLSSSAPVVLGTQRGQVAVTLMPANLPTHTHAATFTPSGTNPIMVNIPASSNMTGNGNQPSPSKNYIAASTGGGAGANMWASVNTNPVNVAGVTASLGTDNGSVTVNPAGSSQPITTIPPSLGVTYCITVTGIYPPQN